MRGAQTTFKDKVYILHLFYVCFTSMKAKELADFYPNDLIVEKLVEEINHMKKVSGVLLGTLSL